jgi:hypothetical protein
VDFYEKVEFHTSSCLSSGNGICPAAGDSRPLGSDPGEPLDMVGRNKDGPISETAEVGAEDFGLACRGHPGADRKSGRPAMTSQSLMTLHQPTVEFLGDNGTEDKEANAAAGEIADPERLAGDAAVDLDRQSGDGIDAGARGFRVLRRAVVEVDSIVVEETFGRELDDGYVDMLARLVDRYPVPLSISVTPDLRLLAGQRWLAAAKKLGWPTVEVVIVEASP